MAGPDILLTGATKFIGRHVLKELRARGVPCDCLVRPQSRGREVLGVNLVEGDLNQPEQLRDRLQGYQTVIHVPNLASMTRVPELVRAYEDAGIKRAVFLSSTGIFTDLQARTKPLRKAAESIIANSDLAFTILRPTLVYGGPDDGNIARLLRFCKRSPVMPVFGSGRALQQPVHVEDLAWAVVEVLERAKTYRRAYNLGGGQVLTYNELVTLAYRVLGKRGFLLHLPVKPTVSLARGLRRAGVPLPVSEEQILRLEENKAYSLAEAERDFGFAPRSFVQGIEEEARFI